MAGYDQAGARRVHDCPGDDCTICQPAIDAAEVERDFPTSYDDRGGQEQYEAHLDRMGGSR